MINVNSHMLRHRRAILVYLKRISITWFWCHNNANFLMTRVRSTSIRISVMVF